jgi:thiol-disulfide isomerase/thioredoxin
MREYKLAPRTGLLAAGIVSGLLLASLAGFKAAFAAPALGQAAPSFTLPDARSGAGTSLSALEQGKKATVVIFIATRCPYSNAYNDRMVALASKYAARGIAFAAINSNQTEPTAEVADHAKSHGFSFPVLKDDNSVVADKYGARVTPEVYVLNAGGALVYHGRIDNSADPDEVKTHDLADALDSVLAGKPVARPETKAFGCTIKRG